ncbi:NAD(P)-dependent oxidoreductase [Candidatus Methylopumilus universalis]|uniref:NAD-dependent epimerase/dehydratase family protein n=1 Tax=Candidatus Methylopumilus universalis TaxID=2588536 RepID=UPI0011210369|nr:NAD(P)-dependent oxidoreductase [Candidatus Methylopumilus universalis]QDC46209.1 NAD(P)-dependent oxidoreductase [Candidatus Methylopumilus universalis]
MKVLLTGASGFIGKNLIPKLLEKKYQVLAIARSVESIKDLEWFGHIKVIQCDLYESYEDIFNNQTDVNILIHLAWQNLPNYKESFHISENFPKNYEFLKAAVDKKIPHILVAGTCLEYGIRSGALSEELDTKPSVAYGIAKDMLRKSLEKLKSEKNFIFQWLRLFYIYGEGQAKNSLLSQLDQAIENGDEEFKMSIGTQLRDYLSINDVADNIILSISNPDIQGVINCCSGNPTSVLDLVVNRCKELGIYINLNRGFYKIPDYEPLDFWGIPAKINQMKKMNL